MEKHTKRLTGTHWEKNPDDALKVLFSQFYGAREHPECLNSPEALSL